MKMKLLSHLMKLLHLMTLPSQQFCLCGTLFNMYDTPMKHALRLAWGFIRVSCTLNMLMWHYINEERDDKSFMGVERVSSP